MSSYLKFKNTSTLDMGVVIQTPPVYEFPSKNVETVNIEGRNGSLYIDKNTYSNVRRSYYIASKFKNNETFITKSKQIIDWLLTTKGYNRLEDSYEPDYYRLAIFKDSGELPNLNNMATAIQITFECKPQRYLKTGETAIKVTAKDTWVQINNPTMYDSKPIIILNASNINIEIKNATTSSETTTYMSTINIADSFNGKIDSELQDCYNDTMYLNNKVTLSDSKFPVLKPGNNWIRITGTGTLTKFEIIPNWWTL